MPFDAENLNIAMTTYLIQSVLAIFGISVFLCTYIYQAILLAVMVATLTVIFEILYRQKDP